jgi:hypothetical protein
MRQGSREERSSMMSYKQVLQSVIAVSLVLLFLVGCGGSAPTAVSEAPAATPTPEPPTATPVPPTATPVPPTPTPEPPTATPTPAGPKAGHWEGEPSVSFEVTTDGNIRDFKIVIPFPPSTCTITFEEIMVEADGAFIIPDSLEKPESPDEEIIDDHLYGKFTDVTAIIGAYKFGLCENNFVMPPSQDKWSAEWKGP